MKPHIYFHGNPASIQGPCPGKQRPASSSSVANGNGGNGHMTGALDSSLCKVKINLLPGKSVAATDSEAGRIFLGLCARWG